MTAASSAIERATPGLLFGASKVYVALERNEGYFRIGHNCICYNVMSALLIFSYGNKCPLHIIDVVMPLARVKMLVTATVTVFVCP